MKASSILKSVPALLAVATLSMAGPAIGAEVGEQAGKAGRNANEIAAGGYPIPGDVRLYARELACQDAIKTPGYYNSLNGAEVADSHRSTLYTLRDLHGRLGRTQPGIRLQERG